MCVRRSNICFILGVLCGTTPVSRVLAWVGFGIPCVVLSASMTKSHKSSAGKPSIRNPTSIEMISDPVELWDTDVCFLHIQPVGANVRLPKVRNTPPDVAFECSRSPAKYESENNPNRQCWAAFTKIKTAVVVQSNRFTSSQEYTKLWKAAWVEGIRIHSCLYTENMILYTESWRATVCRIVQNQLTLTRLSPFRSYSSEDSDERVVIDQPLLDRKSFKRSVVHNSSCGEVHWISSTLAMYSRDESLPSASMYCRTSDIWPSTAL